LEYENVSDHFQINGAILEPFKAFLEITHESAIRRRRPQEEPRRSIVFPYHELQRYSARNGAKVPSAAHRLLSSYFSVETCLLKNISGIEKRLSPSQTFFSYPSLSPLYHHFMFHQGPVSWYIDGLDGRSLIPGKGKRCFFLFSRASRPALGPTQPPIQCVPGLFLRG
jgi:hypothetical protein